MNRLIGIETGCFWLRGNRFRFSGEVGTASSTDFLLNLPHFEGGQWALS